MKVNTAVLAVHKNKRTFQFFFIFAGHKGHHLENPPPLLHSTAGCKNKYTCILLYFVNFKICVPQT